MLRSITSLVWSPCATTYVRERWNESRAHKRGLGSSQLHQPPSSLSSHPGRVVSLNWKHSAPPPRPAVRPRNAYMHTTCPLVNAARLSMGHFVQVAQTDTAVRHTALCKKESRHDDQLLTVVCRRHQLFWYSESALHNSIALYTLELHCAGGAL